MPVNLPKVPRSASPAARAGAGDISERELSRERYNLQTTPPPRLQHAHRKKQLFLTPVNKFTGKSSAPSPNLARIRSCIDEFKGRGASRPVKSTPKALSMEDLTPTKRSKRDGNRHEKKLVVAKVHTLHGIAEEQAAARIGRFMLLSLWRRRREDVRCLRRTLETQASYSERLRIQVCVLKSLMDSDNAKVRLAMKELDRLKQLLRDKDLEKAVLQREKRALENDVCAAEDRVSEINIECRNARNEVETLRTACAARDVALAQERAAIADARNQRDQALATLSQVEEELDEHVDMLANTEAEAAALRKEIEQKQSYLDNSNELLKMEIESRERLSREYSDLKLQMSVTAAENGTMKRLVEELRTDLVRLDKQLRVTRDQLELWPRPLTSFRYVLAIVQSDYAMRKKSWAKAPNLRRMLGLARSWLRYPMSMPEAILWSLLPARHGC